MDKRRIWLTAFSILIFASMIQIANTDSPDKIKVFVSILPQKYFVERIGGDLVDVLVMVEPGKSPATYDPTPKKMSKLSKTNLYFSIGVAFENIWLDKIHSANPQMKIIDTRKGIKLRTMVHPHNHEKAKGMKDPHIWLSPTLVKRQAETIYLALAEAMPEHEGILKKNLEDFARDLDKVKTEIHEILKPIKKRKIMLFHPSLGYFCDEFGFTQIPIETEGKEPCAKSLHKIILTAEKEGINTILVQKQFSITTAKNIAESVGAKLEFFDPLAYDYLDNLIQIAKTIKKACSK